MSFGCICINLGFTSPKLEIGQNCTNLNNMSKWVLWFDHWFYEVYYDVLNPIGSIHKKFGNVWWWWGPNQERLVYYFFLVSKLEKVLKEDVCELFVKSPQLHHIKKPHISVCQAYQNLISLPLSFPSCLITMESVWNPLLMRVLRKNAFNVKVLKPLWNILDSVPSFSKKVHYTNCSMRENLIK